MVGSTSIMASSAEGSQRLMMYALPVIFTPFVINFPAGPGRLLDHDQPVDHGPAVGGEAGHPGAAEADRGGGEGDQAAATAAAQAQETPALRPRSARTLRTRARSIDSRGVDQRRQRPSGRARERVRAILERVVERARPGRQRRGRRGRGGDRRQDRGRGPRPSDRPPRPDDRRGAAALLSGGLPGPAGPQAGRRRRRRLPASAAARRSSARPTAPRTERSRRARRSSSSR